MSSVNTGWPFVRRSRQGRWYVLTRARTCAHVGRGRGSAGDVDGCRDRAGERATVHGTACGVCGGVGEACVCGSVRFGGRSPCVDATARPVTSRSVCTLPAGGDGRER